VNLDEGYFIHAAAREPKIALRRMDHIANYAAARRDWPSLKLLTSDVEAHQSVRLGVRFAIPDYVADRRDSVGLGFRSTR